MFITGQCKYKNYQTCTTYTDDKPVQRKRNPDARVSDTSEPEKHMNNLTFGIYARAASVSNYIFTPVTVYDGVY